MFLQEILLISYIILSLVYSCYVKLSVKNVFLDLKKHFVILLNFGIFILFFIFILNLIYFLLNIEKNTLFFYNDLTYFSKLNHFLNENFGIYFFHVDLITFFLTMVLSFLFILYMCLVKYILRTTKLQYKYLLELPIIIIVIFFSLHLFLITYDLILIVLTLELAAFCSVLLLGLHISTTVNVFTVEAATKYFIFSGVSVLLLLFAISGYYYCFQTLNLLEFKVILINDSLLLLGYKEILMFFHFIFFSAFFFKLGAAPFHFWVPDVYEGAELLITTFLVLIISPTICCKLFFFVKILLPIFEIKHSLSLFFGLIGLLSIIIGTLKAFQQFKIKRFLAYTSITHLGYIILSLSTGSYLGFFAAFFYLFIYIITNLLFFFSVLIIRQYSEYSLLFLNQFKMMFNKQVLTLLFFLIPLFSYAGLPPFLGFFTKFSVLIALIDFNIVLLTISLILYIVINGFLYLRIIKFTLFENPINFAFLPNKIIDNNSNTLTEQNLTQWYRIKFRFSRRKIKRNKKKKFLISNNLLLFTFYFSCVFLFLGCFFLPQIMQLFLLPLIEIFLGY
jgi:NADH-quinone oxidoreductase subunit N